ncbi:MAG: transposase [Saprospiraceae bacterium]|nr:transposase [Saprospiraceae bacterium]
MATPVYCRDIYAFLSIRGRINFLQLARYGKYHESTYRMGFERDFDFLTFNILLVEQYCGANCIPGFDPTYLNKSGKHTPGIGYFYSGTAGKHKRGLEIAGIAVVDVDQNTAYHLEAIQTPSARKSTLEDGQSIVDHYANIIVSRSAQLSKLSTILAVDAYFTKRKFIDPICEKTDLNIVGRLREDANLRYLYNGRQTGSKGRPKQYAGKINVKRIDKRRVTQEYEDDDVRIHAAVVNSVGLKRNVKLCYVEFLNTTGEVNTTKMFFSTDIIMTGLAILCAYRARFQMEFNFRDSKQFTGLQNSQARSKKKIHFHVNAALTTASIGKCIQRNGLKRSLRLTYSISDLTTELFNHNLLKRILSIYPIDANIKINDNVIRLVLDYGKIAA